MGIAARRFIGVMLLLAALLATGRAWSTEPSARDQPVAAEKEAPAAVPDLADIVPLGVKLTGRLADLDSRLSTVLDIASVEEKYDTIDGHLQDLSEQLQQLKNSTENKYNKLVSLREAIKQENTLHEANSFSIKQAIGKIETWRREWQAEQKHWNDWETYLQKETEFNRLKSTFAAANETIGRALDLILSHLDVVLIAQEKAGKIQARLGTLDLELNALIEDERRSVLLDESPPMLSFQFIAQFRNGSLGLALAKIPKDIDWPDRRFLARQGWIVLFQAFLSLFVIVAARRNRPVAAETGHWRFFDERPVSAGLFCGYMATVLLYEHIGGIPGVWKQANMMVGAISFARLMGVWIETPWKRQFINGIVILLIATRLLDMLNLPLPIFRLYTALASLAGLVFCMKWAKTVDIEDSAVFAWSLRAGSLFYAVIICAEFWGKRALASYLFVSMIRSVSAVLVFILFMVMIRGGLERLFLSAASLRTEPSDDETETIIGRLATFIDIAIVGLVLLPALLMIWGVYDSLSGATKGLLAVGFSLGSVRINLMLVLVSVGILYGSFFISWLVQKLLVNEVFFDRRLEKGVRISMGRLAHYAIIIAGFLLAVATLGFEISKITIMISALGVGIGFGLQGIVNNFVSGLILLFERPVRVGDVIQISGEWAEINKIGIRATTVQTFDRADRIIPNSNLISNEVTNWTLTNRQVRVIIPVGVAYGSDVERVAETLMACAQTNPKVARRPPPKVLFLCFGESSLDFELRVFVTDFDHRIDVKSMLHYQIDRAFRESNIEIAFPQRDVHVRSNTPSEIPRPGETGPIAANGQARRSNEDV